MVPQQWLADPSHRPLRYYPTARASDILIPGMGKRDVGQHESISDRRPGRIVAWRKP